MKYDKMIAVNKAESEQKIKKAIRAIDDMGARGLPISVTELVRWTGLSRGFFYKNEQVRQKLEEASFVMAVAFFFIAALLNGVFEVHGRITGRFVLQEAMERCLYREEKTLRGDGMTVGEISSRAGQRLRGFFRCGDAVLTIREDGGDLDGRVKSSTETEISLRGQEPERAIRLLTVLENAE